MGVRRGLGVRLRYWSVYFKEEVPESDRRLESGFSRPEQGMYQSLTIEGKRETEVEGRCCRRNLVLWSTRKNRRDIGTSRLALFIKPLLWDSFLISENRLVLSCEFPKPFRYIYLAKDRKIYHTLPPSPLVSPLLSPVPSFF